MEIEIESELQTAHNKIVLAQQKIDQLRRAGKTRRDEAVKYWNEQLSAWTDYANELNELRQYDHIELAKTIRADGGFHVSVKYGGQHIKGRPFFPQKAIPVEILESLTIEDDYSLNNPPCRRCGERGTQLHHWGPKELFEDAETWPQDYLCRDCHQQWHDVVTNPYRKLRQKDKANGSDNARIRPELSR